MCRRLGWHGLDAFGRRAKMRLDQNLVNDEAGELWEAYHNDDLEAAERANRAHEQWVSEQQEKEREWRHSWSEGAGSNMTEIPSDEPEFD